MRQLCNTRQAGLCLKKRENNLLLRLERPHDGGDGKRICLSPRMGQLMLYDAWLTGQVQMYSPRYFLR